MEVKQTSYGTRKDILFNLSEYSARPLMVESSGISADANGRKIVKAGSILNASGVIVNDATARYVLLQDIDVTAGDAVGAGVYIGTLDLTKIEANTGVTVSADAKTALKGIFFMADANMDYNAGYGNNDAEALSTRVTAVETTLNTETTGVVAKVAALDTTINAATTGLVDRVEVLEAA